MIFVCYDLIHYAMEHFSVGVPIVTYVLFILALCHCVSLSSLVYATSDMFYNNVTIYFFHACVCFFIIQRKQFLITFQTPDQSNSHSSPSSEHCSVKRDVQYKRRKSLSAQVLTHDRHTKTASVIQCDLKSDKG